MKAMLTFQDSDNNTALHLGARNGNHKIVFMITAEAKRTGIVELLVNCRNKKGLTPLIMLAMRGYKSESEKDLALENRYIIIQLLLEGGANADYCKEETSMTALHWLAY